MLDYSVPFSQGKFHKSVKTEFLTATDDVVVELTFLVIAGLQLLADVIKRVLVSVSRKVGQTD